MRSFCVLSVCVVVLGCGGTGGADGGEGGSASSGVVAGSCEPTPERCAGQGTGRPTRLGEHAAAYVPERQELVVFGGQRAVPEACMPPPTNYSAETWIYDDACNSWSIVPGPGPQARARHMAAYGAGAVWVFGGRFRSSGSTRGEYLLFDDLLRFDVETREWATEATPDPKPSPRVDGVFVWDSNRSVFWIHGGNSSTTGTAFIPEGDLWSFDPAAMAWTERTATGPAPRLFHTGIYDSKRDRVVVFGGADETAFNPTATFFRDLWSFDLASSTWTMLHDGAADAPAGRFSPAMVYDTARDIYLLFGGHDDGALGNRNDVWGFDPNSGSWGLLAEGDTFNAPSTGTCMFPADFTTVDLTAPERRHAHTLVWSEPCGHALALAGKSDCGSTDDLWVFSGGVWSERVAATEGEACLRAFDGQSISCVSMCR